MWAIRRPSALPGAGRRRREAHFGASVCGILFLFLVWLSPRSTLWDRDEAIYARVALETRASGALLLPTVDGRPFTHKPPLLAWLQIASLALPVPFETAVRLPSALALAVAGGLTFVAARRLLPGQGQGAGTAILLLLTSPLALLAGAAATTDALLLAASAGSLAALALAAGGERPARAGVELAAAVALGLLAKGPPGLAFPLLSATAVVLASPPRQRRSCALLAGGALAAGLCVFLAWAVPANAASGGLLLADGIGRHVVGRTIQPMEGHGGWGIAGFLFYPMVLVFGFAPWTLFLPTGARRTSQLPRPPAIALLAVSAVAPFLLFSVVATKLPTYVLPAFPALAIVTAAGVESPSRPSQPALVLYLAGGIPWILLLALGTLAPVPPPVRALAAATAALAAALAGAGLALCTRGRPHAAAAAFAGGVLAVALALGISLPLLEYLRPVPSMAAAVRERGGPVAAWGFEEPSLFVYLAPLPVERIASAEEAAAWVHRSGPGTLVTTVAGAASCPGFPGPRVEVLARASGWNVSNGRRVDLVAFARRRE